MTPSSRTVALASASGIAVLAALTACAPQDSGSSTDTDTDTAASNPPVTAPTRGGDEDGSGAYRDGTYRADGQYQSPNGTETVTVEVTLDDDVITEVTVTPHPTNPNTRQFQTAFAGAISGEVVGKSIDEISVSRLAGSSLTSGGFKDALERIKADASS